MRPYQPPTCAWLGIFQSTHPSRDATRLLIDTGMRPGISIHASLAGCDLCSVSTGSVPEDFNPRIPRGMRPGQSMYQHRRIGISIHASLAGCDRAAFTFTMTTTYFNPRIPRGMRLTRCYKALRYSYFNPRIPRGMRPVSGSTWVKLTGISIHASLAGCDARWLQLLAHHPTFQSTHPSRDATFGVADTVGDV